MNPIAMSPVRFGAVYKKAPGDPNAFKFYAHGDYSNEKEVKEGNLGIPLWATDEHADMLRNAAHKSFEYSTGGRAQGQSTGAEDWASFLNRTAQGLKGFISKVSHQDPHADMVELKRKLAKLAQ